MNFSALDLCIDKRMARVLWKRFKRSVGTLLIKKPYASLEFCRNKQYFLSFETTYNRDRSFICRYMVTKCTE